MTRATRPRRNQGLLTAVGSLRQRLRQAGAVFALAVFAAAASAKIPAIGHVFIVLLENEEYHDTFGRHSPAQYLKSLRHRGAALPNYYATSHYSLGNYLALISGQAPNPATNLDCERYEDFVSSGIAADGQAIGRGCVYPAGIQTVANQLERARLSWKGYMEDMGNKPERESATCGHPAVGTPDLTQEALLGDQYTARHNPFVYFHAIIDFPTCVQHVVNLDALAADLRSVDATPNYVFITPNLCNDGHDGGGAAHCVDGEPGGLVSADRFLRRLVPQILASPAYRRDGLLIITFDESEIESDVDAATGQILRSRGDAAACCNEAPGPNIPAFSAEAKAAPGVMNGPGHIGPGGGRVGAVLLSPFIRPGTISRVPYNHYALLRSVEDIFKLEHLGYAARPGLRSFGSDVYTGWPRRKHQGSSAQLTRAPGARRATGPGGR
jgi:phosphatidylinositol-3-phosphatase